MSRNLKKYQEESVLIEALKRGEAQAFEYVFEVFYKLLCAYANKMVSDAEVAEDLVHTVFCNLWIRKESLRLNKSVKSYLFQSVYNAAINYLKHQKIERKYIEEKRLQYMSEGLFLSPCFEENQQEELMKEKLLSAVDKLPLRCREILKMSRFSGLKNREIAEELNISINTVQSQIAIALCKLKKYFRK